MDGASMSVIHENELETEFSKFKNFIKDKAPHTITSYIQNYKKLRAKVGKDLSDVPLEDLVLELGQLSQSYGSQKAFANVWSLCNYKMQHRDVHPSYLKYCAHLEQQIEIQLRAKHKEIKDDVIPMQKLIEHENKMYEEKHYAKYVACFIVRNCFCRNKDLDITVTNVPEVNDTDNFLIVYHDKITVIRQNYKTAKVHGRIQTEFKDKNFVNACKNLPMGEKLFPGADTTAKLQNRLKNALYTNEVQYLNSTIDEISRTGNLKELKRVGDLRGTGVEYLITSYNLDF
jgi:hypothetical protein